MSERTAISWCDATFNPWWGCQKVSPACDHCYAERDSKRFAAGKVLWGVESERRTFADKHWEAPGKWAKREWFQCDECGARGRDRAEGYQRVCKTCGSACIKPARQRVFCASMGDWLDLDAPLTEFVRLLDTIRKTPELDWLLLSKRIGNWHKRLEEAAMLRLAGTGAPARDGLLNWMIDWRDGRLPENVWLGATICNQEEADRDIPKLLATPAAKRFLSIEPMLGPVDPTNIPVSGSGHSEFDPIITASVLKRVHAWPALPSVHWVICGGESGPKARPMHPDWVRSLRDQCAAAGVPFHFKQWGEWLPCEVDCTSAFADDGSDRELPGKAWAVHTFADYQQMARVGTKAAGRRLDGVEHNGFPGQ